MKVRYDQEADAAYIYLTTRPPVVAETKEISDEIFMDYDVSGQPIGIEIIGVTDKVPPKTLRFFKSKNPKTPSSVTLKA